MAAGCLILAVLVVGAVRIDDPASLVVGTVVTELAPFAIGVALSSVVLGTGKMLSDFDLLRKIAID